jgi:AcrR family transcriptional regulator
MTMTAPAELGLRERKRLATRRAIQHAVLTLASEQGLENVTVEEVSRRAEVSPRTFFNYFGTKEEALIGDIPLIPDGDALHAFLTASPATDVLTDLGELLARTVGDADEDVEIHHLRKDVLRDHPHLLGARIASMRGFEEGLYKVVERRVLNDDPTLAEDAEALFDRCWMVTMVGFAGLRHAWRCWADAPTPGSLAERIRRSFAELYTTVQKLR